jgi:glycosyltransferase involved in cell wall biosynthesis
VTDKRIVFIDYTYYHGRGNWDRELIKRLAEKGYEIHAITCPFIEQFKDEEQKLKDLGVQLHFITFNKLGFVIASIIETYKIIRKDKAILYVPSIRLIPFYYPIKKIFKIPIIFSLQGGALKELEVLPHFKKIREHKLLYTLKREIIRLEGKIKLVYYCVDKDKFKKDTGKGEKIRQRCAIKKDDVVIIYVARLSFDVPKRLWIAETLIGIVNDIKRSASIKVFLVGGGDAVQYLKEKAKKSGLDDKIIITGFVSDVSEYLSASDLFFFVIKEPDPTYGLVLLEALSSGLIVITNNSETQKEIIEDGVNGFTVEPNMAEIKQKLIHIVTMDKHRLNRIKENARESVEKKYCWEVVLLEIEEVFELVQKDYLR